MSTQKPEVSLGSYKTYFAGFLLSLMLTGTAYFLVVNHILSPRGLIAAIFTLAIVQLIVQLVFFLHLDKESRPRWNLLAFLFMLLVLVIVVFGSLWIMYNLDYNMMPHEVEQYMQEEERIER